MLKIYTEPVRARRTSISHLIALMGAEIYNTYMVFKFGARQVKVQKYRNIQALAL